MVVYRGSYLRAHSLGGEKIYRITVVVISAEYNKEMYSAGEQVKP